ncbi:hypothetical protein ACFY2Y_06095 [Janibacter hoylei]|uniref:hypothetical protein n=1 Tax=Janibacter hoylei TaxID=364298 RepID=UPI0036B2161F
MLETHEAPWRSQVSFGRRMRHDLNEMWGNWPVGWNRLGVFFVAPIGVPLLLGLAVRPSGSVGERLWTLVLAAALGLYWCSIFFHMLRPGPVVRVLLIGTYVLASAGAVLGGLALLAVGVLGLALGGGVGLELALVGFVLLGGGGFMALWLRWEVRGGSRSARARAGQGGPQDPSAAVVLPTSPDTSHVVLRSPTGEVGTTLLGPMQAATPVTTAAGGVVHSRAAVLLGDPGGRLVVPADVATRPGHVLVTEVLRGGQVHLLVPQSVPSLAMMWRHAQPVPPQEHS